MNQSKANPVTEKIAGNQRLTEPMRQQTPSDDNSLSDASGNLKVPLEPQRNQEGEQFPEDATVVGESSSLEKSESETKARTKSKQEISTLEHFIAYAYGRKGQPLSVKSKVLQEISSNTQIPVEGLAALQRLAVADRQFCVPRQILLASREIEGFSTIKEALRAFVQTAMLWQKWPRLSEQHFPEF